MFVSGESNVYTVGYIGEHKVVSTKLPQIGYHRAAQISSGNTTTRLLGMIIMQLDFTNIVFSSYWVMPRAQLERDVQGNYKG